jgi:hypothetical protein
MPSSDGSDGQGPDQEPDFGRDETASAAAEYIAALAGELSQLARRHGFDTLSQLLDMVRLEADQAAKD